MILKIGHRGAMGYEPENTLRSFEKAVAMGCDMIELDVRICQSGEPVVIHDDSIDRTSNKTGKVHRLTLSSLKKHDFGNNQPIPTLVETLDALQGKCKINIELKSEDTPAPVVKLVEAYVQSGKYRYDDLIISSFNHYWLAECKNLNPKIKIGLLFFGQIIDLVPYAVSFGAYSVHPDIEHINADMVNRAKDNHLKVYVWTVNEPEQIAFVRSMGVDGIITNYPDRL